MDLILYSDFFVVIIILTIFFSLLIDLIMGDPHFKFHPVNLIGNTIKNLKFKLRTGKESFDKMLGIFLLFIVIVIFCVPILLFQILFWWFWNIWEPYYWENPTFLSILIFSLIMGFLLKWTFAIKDLGDSTKKVAIALEQGNLEEARSSLSLIVRRDTKTLDENHIISATIECIAESSTDGVTSAFWFYLMGILSGALIYYLFYSHFCLLFLGLPFAYAFRIINTADSIVGYKDPENIHIGWFSARTDDFSNFIPTRLTTFFMLIVGKFMRLNIINAIRVLKTNRFNTKSVNAGWTMGAMAGLLDVQLEKFGEYQLGGPNRVLVSKDIKTSYQLIKLTSILFIFSLLIIIILIIVLVFNFKWWFYWI